MALFRELGTDFQTCETVRGAASMWVLSPSVYVTVVTGHMEDVHADLFERFGAERIAAAPGKLFVFHDWLEMTGYESRCRQRLTAWSAARLRAYAEVHLAVRSKIVAMGVQVANIPLRGLIRAHRDRASLEGELRGVLRMQAPQLLSK
jgi:hypothetical protein